MKTTNDNPVDPLGTLGAPIREHKPAAPDPIKQFELIGDHSKAVESVVDTLRKQQADDEQWQGCDFSDAYLATLVGCI